MSVELDAFRFITASAYAGMMAPLTQMPSTACVLSGDTDTDTDRNGDCGPAGPGPERLSLEQLDGVRRRWRLGDVGRLADFVPKVLGRSPADPRPALVVPPRLTVAWEQAANGWPEDIRLLGRPARDVSRIADDKIFVRQELRRIGVDVPASLVIEASVDAFAATADALGTPFVLQAPQGAGGAGTYLVETAAQLAAALARQAQVPRWLASAYAGDVTLNVAGIVDAVGVSGLAASVQSSGIAELGAGFGAYCGSDLGRVATLPPHLVRSAHEQTGLIGRWLHALGHRGIFGADIAMSGTGIAFLEVNPRIQGSSWLLTSRERAAGGEGCLVRHVRALLDDVVCDTGTTTPLSGSHLLVRWTGPAGVVRSVPDVATGEPVTVTGLPAVGSIISEGAILARLASDGSLTGRSGRVLRPEVGALLARLRDGVEVRT